jgi:OOP family OmpA-OmpF porin
MTTRFRIMAVLAPLLATVPALAKDHPLIGHLEGSTPAGYAVADFDETNIIVAPMDPATANTQRGSGWKTVEGKIYHVYHRLPKGLSSLAALRSYEKRLQSSGFTVGFTCSTEAGTCFSDGAAKQGLSLGLALDGPGEMLRLDTPDLIRNLFYSGNGRYLLATMDRPEGKIYVSAAFSDMDSPGRFVLTKIVETKELQHTGFTVSAATDMQSRLSADGKVDIYGITFDFDKADIKPESRPQLQEIAKLLSGSPELRLAVVGHTDNQGSESYNAELSARRARAVVAALVSEFGIKAERLSPVGKGFMEPVADNATAEGQARNRRVELVRQ